MHVGRLIVNSAGIACLTAGVALAQAQAPGQQDRATAGYGESKAVTVVGCLKQEKDVPGRSPNVAERAGLGEDFILTNVKFKEGGDTAGNWNKPDGKDEHSKTGNGNGGAMPSDSHRHTMLKIEGLDDDKLRPHVNHQVEIRGQLSRPGAAAAMPDRPGADHVDGRPNPADQPGRADQSARADQRASSNRQDLRQVEATSIRMLAASCSSGN